MMLNTPFTSSRLAGALAMVAAAGLSMPAQASPNLLTNGSFEANGGSFSGWTIGGTGTGSSNNPATAVGVTIFTTDGATKGPYGDIVAPDNAISGSPDSSGTHAAYFVDDNANETLSQNVLLTAGTSYAVGYDYLATLSGSTNPNPFTLSTQLVGTSQTSSLATVTSSTAVPAGSWLNDVGVFTPTTSGVYSFAFDFVAGQSSAKDVLVDRVYVTTAPATLVPEPATLSLLGAGFIGAAWLRRRRTTGASTAS